MKNRILTMMIGLPMAGKSTWISENLGDQFIISAVYLRKYFSGQDYYEPAEPIVWAIRKYLLETVLCQGFDVIVDETNLYVKKRADMITLARKYRYKVDCVYIDTDKSICIKRAGDNIPLIKAINKMDRYREAPCMEEGFININEVKIK